MSLAIPLSRNTHRYARGDGNTSRQRVDIADALRAFADDLLESGDARLALERAFRWGYQDDDGQHVAGLQEHLQDLRHQREGLMRHIERDSFLDGLASELDRIDAVERAGTGEQDRSDASALERLAERLEHGYQSPEAQAELDALVAELQSAGGDGPDESSQPPTEDRGAGQPGNVTGSLRTARAAAADRVRHMLFHGGVPAGDRQRATGQWRTPDDGSVAVQKAADDLLMLAELERVEAALAPMERIGSVTELGDIDLAGLADHADDDVAGWLLNWKAAIGEVSAGAGSGRLIVLPPEVISAIGRDLLKGLFRNASSPVAGEHQSVSRGNAGDPAEETIAWEPGQPLDLNLVSTLSNAVRRSGNASSGSIALHPDDFAVVERTATTAVSTVLAIDRSRSMGQSGSWTAAKKVSLAMHELIRQSYPRDSLDIVAFSSEAALVAFGEIAEMRWDEFEHGTHLQAALELGRRLHRRNRAGTRQIVVITDGEPTLATISGENVFASPPSEEVLNATMAEAIRCTRENIVINLVMLGADSGTSTFAEQVVRVNGGRIFVATNESLGAYILRDYVAR